MKKPARFESAEPAKKDWIQVLAETTPEQWAEAIEERKRDLERNAPKSPQVFPVND